MRRVAIVGLGWVGMPLALALVARGWQVTGSKTLPDGVEAAKMCGIDSYRLYLNPMVDCDSDDLAALLDVDALVVTLPARRSGEGADFYLQAVQEIVDSALARAISRIVFISSTSVYGTQSGTVTEYSKLMPQTDSARTLCELESWLHSLPGTRVDILRLAGLVGPGRHPGRFLAGKQVPAPCNVVNLVHLDDVVRAIILLLESQSTGGCFNLVAPGHPTRGEFYPLMAHRLGLEPSVFLSGNRGTGGKRVDGSLICKQYGFCYRYPDPFSMPLE